MASRATCGRAKHCHSSRCRLTAPAITPPSRRPSTMCRRPAASSSSPPAPTASKSSSTSRTSRSRAQAPIPGKTIIVDDTSQGTRGTKPSYATVHVLGDDFHAENITFQNDFNRTHEQVSAGSQAQALNLEGDRNILVQRPHSRQPGHALHRRARAAASRAACACPPPSSTSFPPTAQPAPVPAPRTPCMPTPTRSYFTHCVVAGNVDFIYGDGNAVFNDCEIHSTAARRRRLPHRAGQVPRRPAIHLRLQSLPPHRRTRRAARLPRPPWRDYASVVYLNCVMEGHIEPAGWREWAPGVTHRLDTAFYAEYKSTGPGANPAAREPKSHQLTSAEAKQFETARFLAGSDHWNPEKQAK